MASNIRCKKIIGGRTYNTETATRIASWSNFDEDPMPSREEVEVLYQTRHRAFFLYLGGTGAYPDENYDNIRPLEPEQAEQWLEKRGTTEQIEALFGEMPEAGDPEARVTIRMPEALHKRLASLAASGKQSLNAWIVRCLEACAEQRSAP